MSVAGWVRRLFCTVTWHRWQYPHGTYQGYTNPSDVVCERCSMTLREWWWS